MNERRRILHDDGGGADVVTLRVTTTDGSTNVGIEMVVTNGNRVYPVTTDSQGKVEMTGLSGGCTIDCETHEISVYEFIATGTMTVDISAYVNSFPVGETRSFYYTGAVSEVQLIPGSYKLQVWGAQGGTYSSYTGGKGGYSEGILTLLQALKVYVFVGGQGGRSGNGGWNGGGGGSGSASYTSGGTSGSSYMACGGGGTDIALVTSSMAYSSYRTNRSSESLLSRIIVAGGGSGGAYTSRSETTSSTTWSIVSTQNLPVSWDNAKDGSSSVFYDVNISGLKSSLTVGETYKLTNIGGGGSFSYIAYYTNGWNYIYSTNFVVNQSMLNSTNLIIRINGGTARYGDTVSVTLQKQTTTSSTSNTYDAAYGYVGGGTSGGGNYPGKQNAAGTNGAFGLGANQQTSVYRHCAACGGGGWYGGGGGLYSDSSKTYVRYSGGGSGFVNIAANASYRPSGYTGIQLDSGETKAGNTSFPNTAGTGNETGHAGNGYAKITRFAVCTITLIVKDEDNLPVEGASLTVASSENTYTGTTDANGEATFTVQNGTYNVSCVGYALTPSQITVSRNATFRFMATENFNFSYTGTVQTKTLKAGTYMLEVWGAQGGSSTYHGLPGGKGGYSKGILTISEQTTVYIYVGGQGNTGSYNVKGGWNGGGGVTNSYNSGGDGNHLGTGGGASDISLIGGECTLDGYNRYVRSADSYNGRIIVAGGGGGSESGQGGYGGGVSGGGSYPGTQSSAGAATNANAANWVTLYAGGKGYGVSTSGGHTSHAMGSCGGGGYYGGGAYAYNGQGAYGCGGSGYVSNQLTDAQTIDGNTSFPAPSGGTETGHSGNGFVRITKI